MEVWALISKCVVPRKYVNVITIRLYGTSGQGLRTYVPSCKKRRLPSLINIKKENNYQLLNLNSATKMSFSESVEHRTSIKKYTYEETITTLNNLQSNAATIKQSKKDTSIASRNLNLTSSYLEKVGIAISDLSKLNAIHISGTKGKGSTCAFTESILRNNGLKTGFYSSPHLVAVRERIRINGKPISEESFIKYFWEVYSRLCDDNQAANVQFPPYFMFLTVLSFYTFLQEKVDVAVIEVGIGGEYDCTNVLTSPIAIGVTSIGIDHIDLLGDTVEKIAWHKSGIFKKDVPAFTVTQAPGALTVLQNRAFEIGCSLWLCPSLNFYSCNGDSLQLGMSGPVQKTNAALALQLANCWFQKMGKENDLEEIELLNSSNSIQAIPAIKHAETFPVSKEIANALKICQWPGRFQIVHRGPITYFLDGAHTSESISLCLEWFIDASQKESIHSKNKIFRALLFNCTGGRKAEFLLSPLTEVQFDVALFSPNIDSNRFASASSGDRSNLMVEPMKEQEQCEINRNIWCYLQSSQIEEKAAMSQGNSVVSLAAETCQTVLFTSISEALAWINSASSQNKLFTENNIKELKTTDFNVHVLVTGSLHLVGGVLAFIQPENI